MFINLTWNYKIKLKFLDELLAMEIRKLFDLKMLRSQKLKKLRCSKTLPIHEL